MNKKALNVAVTILVACASIYATSHRGTPWDATSPKVTAPTGASNKMIEYGKYRYNISCASCHGADGTGHGPLSANLRSQPRDLTRGIFLNRSTASGELPTDYDLYHTITEGLHNTAMPSFRHMTPEDRWAIVQYIKTFSARFNDTTEYPLDVINVGDQILPSPLSFARGRQIYNQMQCANCHGTMGKGDGPSSNALQDDFRNQIYPTDLTNPSDYKFSHTVLDIFRVFSTGLNGTPMPSFAASLSDTDRWHLANYVWALQNQDQYVELDTHTADSVISHK